MRPPLGDGRGGGICDAPARDRFTADAPSILDMSDRLPYVGRRSDG